MQVIIHNLVFLACNYFYKSKTSFTYDTVHRILLNDGFVCRLSIPNKFVHKLFTITLLFIKNLGKNGNTRHGDVFVFYF